MTQTSEVQMITSVSEVRKALAAIELNAQVGDFERAHGLEKDLWEGVLEAIASGNAQAGYIAAEALKSKGIEFQRLMA